MDEQRNIRQPAVAGLFYPDDPENLKQQILALMEQVPPLGDAGWQPKALVAPHAGLRYSGPVAASAYATLGAHADSIRRVVLLGPSHRIPFRGVATTTASAYRTPLGLVRIDRPVLDTIEALPGVTRLDEAHRPEHSLEVHLPFLQIALPEFTLVPLVVGEAEPETVASVLEALWGGPDTLIIVSSDLSHYLDYRTAKAIDAETCRAIECCDGSLLDPYRACGCRPLAGLLRVARERGLKTVTLDLRNSGDTAGPRTEVVGYGAWAFH